MADVLTSLLILAMAANGFRRGCIKEAIHSILWFGLGIAIAVIIMETVDPDKMEMADIPKMLQDIGSIFGFAYLMVIVLEKFVITPMVFQGRQTVPSMPSRFTGAAFGAFKILLLILISTFLHKVYSDSAEPELPPFFENSDIVYFIDGWSIDLYEYVTDKGWLDYEKVVWEEKEFERENPLANNPLESILNSTGNTLPSDFKIPNF